MRDARTIEGEIDHARADLEATLGALKQAVRDKLDVRKHVRDAVGRRTQRGKELVDRARRRARERPLAAGILALGLVMIVALFVGQRRRRRAVR